MNGGRVVAAWTGLALILCSACSTPHVGFTNNDGGTEHDGGGPSFHMNDGAACTGLACQQVSCPNGTSTTVSGTVYAPNGTLPLYNVVVYVPTEGVTSFPLGVQCEQCGVP